jgi:probable DNA metabolism protein
MIRQVQGEIHRMHAFIRLEQSNNILHAYAKFEHDIGLEVAKKLARRTPDMIIILGDENRSYKAIYTNSKYYAQKLADYKTTLKNFGIEKTESQIKKLWENYYWSQYAKSRTNLKLFRKHVPKKIFENTECELSRCESEICRAKQTKLF